MAADAPKIRVDETPRLVATNPPMRGEKLAAVSVAPKSKLKIRPSLSLSAASPNEALTAVARIVASNETNTIPAPRRNQPVEKA
jgi:hypothetical protein